MGGVEYQNHEASLNNNSKLLQNSKNKWSVCEVASNVRNRTTFRQHTTAFDMVMTAKTLHTNIHI